MRPSRCFRSVCSVFICMVQMSVVTAGTQFASHVSVNTPTRSFSHGVGDPLRLINGRPYQQRPSFRQLRRPVAPVQGGSRGGGYPKEKPSKPFDVEDRPRDNSFHVLPWGYNSYMAGIRLYSLSMQSKAMHGVRMKRLLVIENNIDCRLIGLKINIPLLPLSPYKVDSPDPESLWPDGLFLPPLNPTRFDAQRRSLKDNSGTDSLDPYLLQGSEAIAAVRKTNLHGHMFFHDIPHIKSLLKNQELRIKNKLRPHRLGSIRHTWPYNRP